MQLLTLLLLAAFAANRRPSPPPPPLPLPPGRHRLHRHPMVKLAIVHCRRKRQQQQHHQRTNGSTNVKMLQVQMIWTYLTYLQYQGNLAISKLLA
jgi:hypothetical protein